mmetsp:Transcript_48784/g.86864  ORF Transcript_48784/g.86864 Transcript_48784/m.86864 type:complete len:259 (+) Transcript_48784:219-995(+)
MLPTHIQPSLRKLHARGADVSTWCSCPSPQACVMGTEGVGGRSLQECPACGTKFFLSFPAVPATADRGPHVPLAERAALAAHSLSQPLSPPPTLHFTAPVYVLAGGVPSTLSLYWPVMIRTLAAPLFVLGMVSAQFRAVRRVQALWPLLKICSRDSTSRLTQCLQVCRHGCVCWRAHTNAYGHIASHAYMVCVGVGRSCIAVQLCLVVAVGPGLPPEETIYRVLRKKPASSCPLDHVCVRRCMCLCVCVCVCAFYCAL